MKKSSLLFPLIAAFALVSCDPGVTTVDSTSSESTSSAQGAGTSSASSSSEGFYDPDITSTSYEPYEEEIEAVYNAEIPGESRLDSSISITEHDNVVLPETSLTINISDYETYDGGFVTLFQGGQITNNEAYSCWTGLSVTFTSSSDIALLMGKASYWKIDNGSIGATRLVSGERINFDEGCRYFTVFSSVGDVDIVSITLYSDYDAANPVQTLDAIDIYTINDTHGAIEESEDYHQGIANLTSSYKNAYADNVDGSVILSCGDMWQGSAMSNMSYGKAMVEWMNYVGFDSMSIGNHEFDWKASVIETNTHYANFPFLGINIVDGSGQMPEFIQPSTVVTRGGVRIGIIGAIGLLSGSILPSSLGEYQFAYYSGLVNQECQRLRIEQGCDIVVLAIHNGDVDTTYFPDIDAVFLGHTHSDTYYVDSNGIPHLQTWANGSNIRYARFVRNGDRWVFEDEDRELTYYYATHYLTEDADTLELIGVYESQFAEVMNEVVGYSETGYSQSELASIGCQSLYEHYLDSIEYPKIDVAIVNSGCSRQSIEPGDITYGDLYAVFPFDNDHVFATIYGRSLNSISGVSYPRIPYEFNTLYTVCIISYVYEGREDMFEEEIARDSVFRLRDCAAEYFRNLQ